ncbi:hypothetical protein PTKIN_Ptkin03bG0187400 [Pterospermum kingtungense]
MQIESKQSFSWNIRKLLQLKDLVPFFTEVKDGIATWKLKGTKYSVSQVFDEIRPKLGLVVWSKLLWSSFSIPKHSMIAWMAFHRRLPTLDRLASWGIQVNQLCLLCQHEMETHDHLFFGCAYSKSIWQIILCWCGINRFVFDWHAKLSWSIQKLKGKAFISGVLRLSWRAFIYHIWLERNFRLYKKKSVSPL